MKGFFGRALWPKLLSFALLSVLFALAGSLLPLRRIWSTDAGLEVVRRMGAWGPLAVLVAGALAPLALLPRWPIAVGCGLLYGLGWGGLLANVASTLGAWIQFRFARRALGATAERLLARYGRSTADLPPGQALMLLVALRAFPFSSFVATNLLAASLGISSRRYVLGSFLGMLPSTLMYGAWGHMAARPRGGSYLLGGSLLVFAVLAAVIARRRLAAALPSPPGNSEEQPLTTGP